MPPQIDETTAQIVSAAQRDLKQGASVGDGEIAEYSLDNLRHADDAIGNRDTDASWRRRLQREILRRDQASVRWHAWIREHAIQLLVTVLAIVVGGVVLGWFGL